MSRLTVCVVNIAKALLLRIMVIISPWAALALVGAPLWSQRMPWQTALLKLCVFFAEYAIVVAVGWYLTRVLNVQNVVAFVGCGVLVAITSIVIHGVMFSMPMPFEVIPWVMISMLLGIGPIWVFWSMNRYLKKLC